MFKEFFQTGSSEPRHSPATSHTGKIAQVLLAAALLAGFTGCTTYVQSPPVVYREPPPAPVVVTPPEAPVSPPEVVYVLPPPVEPTVAVEIHVETDFYGPLTPYGRWVFVGP